MTASAGKPQRWGSNSARSSATSVIGPTYPSASTLLMGVGVPPCRTFVESNIVKLALIVIRQRSSTPSPVTLRVGISANHPPPLVLSCALSKCTQETDDGT